VLWENLEITDTYRRCRQLLSGVFSIGVLLACLLLVQYVSHSPTLVGVVVGIVSIVIDIVSIYVWYLSI